MGFIGNVKKRLRDIKIEDFFWFTIKEGIGLIPFAGPLFKNALNKFFPEEKSDQIKEVNIPTIQFCLKKEEISKGKFFRKEPAWVDYKKGYIVKREEVDEIKNRLDNEKIQLVLGNPASGKSIILKNVGFKLANEDKKVYVIELKKHLHDEVNLFFENILEIDCDNPIFIVDDAHLNLSGCERLIRNFKVRGKGRLIIGSRETKEITEGDPTQSSELEHLSKMAIKIQAEDVTERMIKTFLETQYHFDEGRILVASDKLEEYKKDLWYLSWALKAYNSDNNSVDEDNIYKNIKEKIEKINAQDVFLPLSIFFRFEMPIERKFLEKQMGLKESIIEDLIKRSEIVETEEIRKPIMLSLHHSSIAELYFNTYLNYPSLGIDIKENILNGKEKEYLEYCLFYRYITTTDPRNSLDVVNYLDVNWQDGKGKTLLKNVITEEKIQKSVINGLDKEEDLEKVRLCISLISEVSQEVAHKLVDRINIDALSSKIGEEGELYRVASCVSNIAEISEEVAMKLVESVSSKIVAEEDLEKVRFCVSEIASASEEVAMKLVNSVSVRIDNEEDIWWVSRLVYFISQVSQKVAMKLVEEINIDTLLSKIEKEEDIEEVGYCVIDIDFWANKSALKLVDRINIDTLSSKIDKEEDLSKVASCVLNILDSSQEVAMKLVDRINIDVLSSKIDKEKDMDNVEFCVTVIVEVSEEVGLKLVDSVSVINEDNIRTAKWLVSSISEISQKAALKLVEKINIVNISSKIDEEGDIEVVLMFVYVISKANQEVALKLLEKINMDALSSKIEKEEDIGKVGSCVNGIAQVSQEVANKILNRLNPELRGELKQSMTEHQTPSLG